MTVTTLHICTTCRVGQGDNTVWHGRQLHAAIQAGLRTDAVAIREAQCLSACAHGCTASLSCPGKSSYVIGGLDESMASDLLAFAELHAAAPEGIVPKLRRPARLAGAVLGRVPP